MDKIICHLQMNELLIWIQKKKTKSYMDFGVSSKYTRLLILKFQPGTHNIGLTVSCVAKVCIHEEKWSILVLMAPNDTLRCFWHTYLISFLIFDSFNL